MTKRILFIGQAPAKPNSKHSTPGTYLNAWLKDVGFQDPEIRSSMRFYALIDTFPGSNAVGHLRPTPSQIAAHKSTLIAQIQTFKPDIIVAVGRMAIDEVLQTQKSKLTDIIGNVYMYDPFDCLDYDLPILPLPHPSGRSTWLIQHQDLVRKALATLKQLSSA